MKQTYDYSPNFGLPKRLKKKIKFVVLHYTGMKNEFSAIKRLQDPKFKVSSHYLIKKNGEIITAQENELNFLKEKFISKTGGEAICEMLKRVDLSEKTDIINEIEKDLSNRLWLAKETEEYKLNKEEFESKEE